MCTLTSWTLLTTPTEVRHKSTIGARNKNIVSGKLEKPKRDWTCFGCLIQVNCALKFLLKGNNNSKRIKIRKCSHFEFTLTILTFFSFYVVNFRLQDKDWIMHNKFLCIALVLAFGCVSCVSSLKGTGVCSFLQRFLLFIYNYCDTVYVLFYSQYYCTYLAHTSPYIFILTYPQMEYSIKAAASPQLLCVILISLLRQC